MWPHQTGLQVALNLIFQCSSILTQEPREVTGVNGIMPGSESPAMSWAGGNIHVGR